MNAKAFKARKKEAGRGWEVNTPPRKRFENAKKVKRIHTEQVPGV